MQRVELFMSQEDFRDLLIGFRKRTEGDKEYYYIDSRERKDGPDKATQRVLDSLALSKMDGMLLLAITLFLSVPSLVNIFLGNRAVLLTMGILTFLLLWPFYVGYVKGAVIMDDMENRVKGWEALVVVAFVFTQLYVTTLVSLALRSLHPLCFSIWGLPLQINNIAIGLVLLPAIFILFTLVTLYGRRGIMVRLIEFYFDRYPSRRAELVEACTWRGIDPRINPLNLILPAMMEGKDLDYTWMGRRFQIEKGAMESRGFITKLLLENLLHLFRVFWIAHIGSLLVFALYVAAYNPQI